MGKGKLIDEIFGEKCEDHYIQPTFIIDYPVEMSPLTKKHRSKPGLVERFELIINGKEIANAYATLVNPARRAAYDAQCALARAHARRRTVGAIATMAASFTLTVGSGVAVAGWLLGA